MMMIKEYRLASWPELAPAYHRTAFRRMLSAMSQRHMTLSQLADSSGLRRTEVQEFLDTLENAGILLVRETHETVMKMPRWSLLRQLGSVFRRTLVPAGLRR